MILYVDLRTGEVRDPAIGVVGKVTDGPKAFTAWLGGIEKIAIELDDAKINQKRDRSVF